MNKFYHRFVPGLNAWYVVAIGLPVAMVLFGARLCTDRRKVGGKVVFRRTTDVTDVAIVAVATGLFGYLVFQESFLGAVQLCDNWFCARYQWGVGSLLVALAATLMVVVTVGCVSLLGLCKGKAIAEAQAAKSAKRRGLAFVRRYRYTVVDAAVALWRQRRRWM